MPINRARFQIEVSSTSARHHMRNAVCGTLRFLEPTIASGTNDRRLPAGENQPPAECKFTSASGGRATGAASGHALEISEAVALATDRRVR